VHRFLRRELKALFERFIDATRERHLVDRVAEQRRAAEALHVGNEVTESPCLCLIERSVYLRCKLQR
jgi:hypothetical protein